MQRNRKKAWTLFLLVWWVYPFCRMFYHVKTFIIQNVDIIEDKFNQMEDDDGNF